MPLTLPITSLHPFGDIEVYCGLSRNGVPTGLYIKNYDGSYTKIHHSGMYDGFYILQWDEQHVVG